MPQDAMTLLESLLADVAGPAKAASTPLSEPGGHDGPSSHPSAHVDDQTIPARSGFRAQENERDVKDNRESPTVDGTPAATAGSTQGTPGQDAVQLHVGLTPSSTGGDPSSEDDFKGSKDDPGTTSAMKADDGEKYAGQSFAQLRKQAAALGNAILAGVAAGAAAPAASPAAPAPTKQASAADLAEAQALIEAAMVEASTSADLAIDYLRAIEKEAADLADQDGAGRGEDDAPPAHAHGGGKDMPPAAPPAAPPADGPGGPGGPPAGLAGAVAGEPGLHDPEQAVHEFVAAALEMGITPEQLAAVAQQMADAGGGPGGPGGPPPEAAETLAKAAHAGRRLQRSGRYAFKAATAANEPLRAQMRGFIAECLAAVEKAPAR